MTVAAFMDLALYDPHLGYYARAAQRSGRAGDFFTSVDVGPLFGELLAVQIAEMVRLLQHESSGPPWRAAAGRPVDLVEAGAGNGRLSADILRALQTSDPESYSSIRLHLIEASAAARAAQPATLGGVRERLSSSRAALPDSFEGILLANELLDAMPVHQVVMREDGLREVYVDVARPSQGRAALRSIEGPPSTEALERYLDHAGVQLHADLRCEINLRAVEWVRDAARRMRRGLMILIDYGHEARELYSMTHSLGTLTTFRDHRSRGAEEDRTPAWLCTPGDQDITAHVDFTSIRAAAEGEGMETIAFLDQTYFLLALAQAGRSDATSIDRADSAALKTLVMPGGLGSTMKVLLMGKRVGRPHLTGCSFRVRVT
jgi:SAM-dependent MidA family methyltransferase